MIATRGSVRFTSSDSNPFAPTQTSGNEKTGPTQPPSAGVYGQWTPTGFAFYSPEEQANWHRDAYRQAVSHESWHKGQIVDPDTAHLIDAGVAGAMPPTFRGPDGQLRYFGTQTAEGPDVGAIRARHFRGAKRADLEGPTMPGEDEVIAHLADSIPSNLNPESSAAIAPADVVSQSQHNFEPSADKLSASYLMKSQVSPLAPEGKLILAAESVPDSEISYPEGVPRRTATPNESPLGRFQTPNANDNYRSPANSNEPEFSDGVPTSYPTNRSQPIQPSGIGASSTGTSTGPEADRANALERAAHNAIFGETRDDNWLKRWAEDAEGSQDPMAAAKAVEWAVTSAEPIAIHDYTYNSRDWDRPANPIEIDAIRNALQEQVLKYFSDDAQKAIRQQWATHDTIIKNGAVGLQSALSLFRNADRLSIFINGREALPERDNPIVVFGGRLGGERVRRLDAITDEEAKKRIAACTEFADVKTVGGGAPYINDNQEIERHKQFWIQDLLDKKNAKGGRYMDVSIRFKVGGEDCDLHINTVDVTRSGIIKEHEWEAIQAAAEKMRRNGALLDEIGAKAQEMLRGILVSRMNTFLTIPKMGRDATDDEIREHVNDFLDLLSCSDIEAACKTGKVNVFDGRDKVLRHGT
jgi:hypothetical protein